jgi:PAS domain-containing protein
MSGRLEALASYTMAVLSGLGDAVIVLDPHGRIAELNPLAERLTAVDARGKAIDDVCRAPLSIAALVAQVMRDGAVASLPSGALVAAGAIRGTLLPIRDGNVIRGVLFVFAVAEGNAP